MPLYYDEFSDLRVDWPMILVGWRGVVPRKLSAEQVVAYALEQVGKGTAEQDGIAALLANTDPQDWQTIDRYLEQIVGEQQFDKEIAVRRWRLAELKHLLTVLQPLLVPMDEDESYSVFYTFVDFWLSYNEELPDSAGMIPQFGEEVPRMLAEQQVWAEREEMMLHGEIGVAGEHFGNRVDTSAE